MSRVYLAALAVIDMAAAVAWAGDAWKILLALAVIAACMYGTYLATRPPK